MADSNAPSWHSVFKSWRLGLRSTDGKSQKTNAIVDKMILRIAHRSAQRFQIRQKQVQRNSRSHVFALVFVPSRFWMLFDNRNWRQLLGPGLRLTWTPHPISDNLGNGTRIAVSRKLYIGNQSLHLWFVYVLIILWILLLLWNFDR